MAQIAIVSDSSASIPKDLQVELDIRVVPVYINYGDQSWRDLVDMSQEEFYRWLPTLDALPTTAYPGPGDFLQVYEELAVAGKDQIISIHVSARSSGTAEGAQIAAGMLSEKNKDVKVEVIDSQNVAMAHGWMVIEAARAVKAGATADQVKALIARMIPVSEMIQTADTLKYLQMGGRIGKAQYLVGNMLNIKPLIGMRDGVIVPLGRERSRAKAYRRMVDLVVEAVGKKGRIKVAYVHAAAIEEVEKIRALLETQVECVETIIAELSPALGVHAGPGATGICYYKADVLQVD